MNWTIVTVGRPRLAFARLGLEEYSARLARVTTVHFAQVPASDAAREGEGLLRQSEGKYRVVLDGRGTAVTSRGFAERTDAWEQQRVKGIALLIGGADGHSAEVRAAADWSWSLGPLTLQHELALVVALEQIYRAYSIKAGAPYHRE